MDERDHTLVDQFVNAIKKHQTTRVSFDLSNLD